MTRNSSDHFLNSSLLRGPATNKPGKKVSGTFYEGFASLPIVMLKPDGNEPSENTLELQNLECTDSALVLLLVLKQTIAMFQTH